MHRLLTWPTSCLVILCAGLSAFIWMELLENSPTVKTSFVVTPTRSQATTLPYQSGFNPPSGDLIKTITARPLFFSSRLPYIPLQINETVKDVDIKLLCVLTTMSVRTALVRLRADEEPIRIQERDFISDWQVERISPDHLYLRRSGDVRIIDLWPIYSG